MKKRFDAVDRRLERIENLLADHDRRITVLEGAPPRSTADQY